MEGTAQEPQPEVEVGLSSETTARGLLLLADGGAALAWLDENWLSCLEQEGKRNETCEVYKGSKLRYVFFL